MRFSDGPRFEPSSRESRGHVLPYSLPISQCTPLHSRARRLLAIIQSGSGAGIIRKARDDGDGQVRMVQQTEEGHSRSDAAVGVAKIHAGVERSMTASSRV
jgi:hypothetical protein